MMRNRIMTIGIVSLLVIGGFLGFVNLGSNLFVADVDTGETSEIVITVSLNNRPALETYQHEGTKDLFSVQNIETVLLPFPEDTLTLSPSQEETLLPTPLSYMKTNTRAQPDESPQTTAGVVTDFPDTVHYNVATGGETTIPRRNMLQHPIEPIEASTPPCMGASSSTRTVFPPDDRSKTASSSYPWCTICKLEITGGDGNPYMGTAFIVDKNHALTAGHCVYDSNGWAQSIEVIPGMSGSNEPYGSAWVTYMTTYSTWTSNPSSQTSGDDWALLTLDSDIGDTTGWMGRMTVPPSDPIYTGTLNTAGYPGDLDNGQYMYFCSGKGLSATNYEHFYNMDTAGGQSGSPVWVYTSGDRYVLSINAYMRQTNNSGTRLDRYKYDSIDNWINDDAPAAQRADLVDYASTSPPSPPAGQSYTGFTPTVLSSGTTFTTWSSITNTGIYASGGFFVSFYASTNTVISTSDYLLGSAYVSTIQNSNYDVALWTGTFPNIPDGKYYIGWIIDSGSDVTETDENNNIAYESSYQLTVDSTPPSNPTSCSDSGSTSGQWTNDNDPDFSWSGYSDATSGVSGFYYYWGPSSSGTSTSYTTSAWYNPPALSSSGTYYLRVRTEDIAGNVAGWSTLYIYKYDGTAPSNPTSCSDPSTTSGIWTNDNDPDFTWSGASDSHSGIHGYYYYWGSSSSGTSSSNYVIAAGFDPPPISSSGTYYLRVRAKDNVGNLASSWITCYTYKYDGTKPNTFTPTATPAGWTNTDPAITFSTTDATSGIDHYEVDTGSGFKTQNSPYTVMGLVDGTHTIKVRAYDHAGNYQEATADVKIDKTTPEPFAPIAAPLDWTNIDPTITFSTTDATSGIDYYEVDIGDGNGFQKQTSPYTVVGLADGTYTINVRAYDRAANYQEGWVDVKVDKTAPETFTPVATPGDWTNTNPTITFSTTDAASGIDRYEVDFGSGFSTQTSPYTITELSDGKHTIKVRAFDKAGNYIECTVDVKIDKTKPNTFTPVASPHDWTNTDPTITFSTTDATSGIDHYEVDSGSGFYNQSSPYIVDGLSDGEHEITVRSYDKAGNHIEAPVSVYIDKSKPEIFTASAEPADWSSNTQPVISFSATDITSGIDHYEIKIDDGSFSTRTSPYTLPKQSDGVHNITIRAHDKAGNYRDTFVHTYVDTKPPTILDKSPTGTDVDIKLTITVKFSETMNCDVTETAFTISPAVDGEITWDENTLIFTPRAPLAYDTEYSVTISTKAADIVDNTLEKEFTWSFTTIIDPTDTDNDGTPDVLDTDDDNDDMPDTWETAHGLNPLIKDEDEDEDKDGVDNLAEYESDTDPTDPASKPITKEAVVAGMPLWIWLVAMIIIVATIVISIFAFKKKKPPEMPPLPTIEQYQQPQEPQTPVEQSEYQQPFL